MIEIMTRDIAGSELKDVVNKLYVIDLVYNNISADF